MDKERWNFNEEYYKKYRLQLPTLNYEP